MIRTYLCQVEEGDALGVRVELPREEDELVNIFFKNDDTYKAVTLNALQVQNLIQLLKTAVDGIVDTSTLWRDK